MIYGLDISLRNYALVNEQGTVVLSAKTNRVNLQSTVREIVENGVETAEYIYDFVGINRVFVDYTLQTFCNRSRQVEVYSTYMGAILATLWLNNVAVECIEPREIRKWLGLSQKAKKTDVWNRIAYEEWFDNKFQTEHEKDAYVLALYGRLRED
jgi:hypothetical protein